MEEVRITKKRPIEGRRENKKTLLNLAGRRERGPEDIRSEKVETDVPGQRTVKTKAPRGNQVKK